MRRAIVHIGTPRTGTTTLQRILSSRRDELRRRGILYPDLTPSSASEPHLSHQYLGEALSGRRPASECRELLDSLSRQVAAAGCDIILLSYESLCLIPPSFRAPEILSALFARLDAPMETLITVKPQAEYLNSTYTWRMQFLRESRSFEPFLRASLAMRDLDFERLSAPWRDASSGRITVVPVRAAGARDPLVGRIVAAIGLGERMAGVMDGGDFGLVENRSPGPVAVEVCRRLRAGGAALALGRRAREATRFVEQAARARGCDAASFIGHDDALRAVVQERWGAANDRFAQRNWGAPWWAAVAPEPIRKSNEMAGGDGEMEADVRDVLQQTCAAFGLTLASPPVARLRDALAMPAAGLRRLRRGLRGLMRG